MEKQQSLAAVTYSIAIELVVILPHFIDLKILN